MRDAKHDAQILLGRRVAAVFRFLGGSFLESVDWESDMQDVQDCATSEDFSGPPADVPWMNQQLFNVLASKIRGNLFQTVKNMSEEQECYNAGAWVKLLRAYKGKNASRSQRLTGRVHTVQRMPSYSEVKPH